MNLLFICSENRLRSPSGEEVFSDQCHWSRLNTMTNLFTYIFALKEPVVGLSVLDRAVKETVCMEDDLVINSSELIVTFANGVRLKRHVEHDQLESSSDVCSECWITYEIVSRPEDLVIAPDKKSFTNQCQESFWLKMNKIQAGM